MSETSRRDFLGWMGALLAGGALAGGAIAKRERQPAPPVKKDKEIENLFYNVQPNTEVVFPDKEEAAKKYDVEIYNPQNIPVNVRSAPSLGAGVVDQLQNGQKFEDVSRWWGGYVRSSALIGYRTRKRTRQEEDMLSDWFQIGPDHWVSSQNVKATIRESQTPPPE